MFFFTDLIPSRRNFLQILTRCAKRANTPIWKESAVFIIEDDAQMGLTM